MCSCQDYSVLIDITQQHAAFKAKLTLLDIGDWVLLMQCPDCQQLYKVDEWDKYQTCYAVKLPLADNWTAFDSESLIKAQIVKQRGGLSEQLCIYAGCHTQQINGSAYCVDHLYASGTHK